MRTDEDIFSINSAFLRFDLIGKLEPSLHGLKKKLVRIYSASPENWDIYFDMDDLW